jgi:hypothetical protein
MTSDNERTAVQFSYDADPSLGIVKAVAWIKGVEPTQLEPLHDVLDPDALDDVLSLEKDSARAVTFSYEGYDIHVDSHGHVVVRDSSGSIHEKLDQPSNVLVLERDRGHCSEEMCADLLRTEPYDQENVLSVTYSSSQRGRRPVWNRRSNQVPANIGLITVGDFTRSSSQQSTTDGCNPGHIHVDTVPDPSNLSDLGVRISECLSAWEDTENQTVMCFRSLTELLHHVETSYAFRFLHILTARITNAEAVAHYHLDVEAHDEQTVETLKPLFDTVIEIDQTGDWGVESQ